MSQRKITRLQLDPKLTTRLLHHSLTTAHDLLACPPLTLMHIADKSYSDATALLALVGSKLIQPHTAYEALQQSNTQQQCVPSGVSGSLTHSLTNVTGGFPVGTISEVCGPPGIGKTQLCLGCCADVLMQYYMKSHDASSDYLSSSVSGSVSGSVSVCGSGKRGGSVVYYDTELKFSSQRLLEIILKRYPQSAQPSVSDPSVTVAVKLLEKLSVRRPMTCQELRDDLLQLEEHLISEGTSLIVVDSIAALPRNEGVTRKEEECFALQQAVVLQSLAEACSCAVIVTNQIVQVNQSDAINNGRLGHTINDASGILKPALGIAWYHCIATRVVLYRSSGEGTHKAYDTNYNKEKYLPEHEQRIISLEKSPIAANIKASYKISPQGIEVVDM